MSAAYATFGLVPAFRAGGVLPDGGYQIHRDFTDFVVDGKPLLFRFPDLDAVTPLASDVPPEVLAAQVRGLLLEGEPPLPGGRFVVYGCPECADLACGALTAVVERDGGDVVWRDFAWQDGERAEPERDGYGGTGPFRFRGPAYRAALTALLDRPDAAPAPRPHVLVIGPRAGVPARLAAALRGTGIGADVTPEVDDVPAAELRRYGAVLYAPGVPEAQRAAVHEAFTRSGVSAAHVDALAPIVPLLVAQTEQALDRDPLRPRRITTLTADRHTAVLDVATPCRVRLLAYRRDRLHRVHVRELLDEVLPPGSHHLPLDPRAVRGNAYVVARTTGTVLTAPVAP
ncbi:oxidoreductase [Streptomyces sp. NPDC059575]|uniref:oxidoreductase n=1 Tax=Streptomyces sp. NPDC059575 TaxID=3346872 RepID=UPI0036951B79